VADLRSKSREYAQVNCQRKGTRHGRSTRRPERGQVRTQGHGGQPLWLDPHLTQRRTHDDVWVRTSVSLIGFGFAIVQFFNRMQQMPESNPARFPEAPRYLGLAVIFCGILALVVSIWEYRWTLRYLWGGDFTTIAGMTKEGKQTPIVAVAGILLLIGMFAFFAVLLRLV
jgi:putative membrane protein